MSTTLKIAINLVS